MPSSDMYVRRHIKKAAEEMHDAILRSKRIRQMEWNPNNEIYNIKKVQVVHHCVSDIENHSIDGSTSTISLEEEDKENKSHFEFDHQDERMKEMRQVMEKVKVGLQTLKLCNELENNNDNDNDDDDDVVQWLKQWTQNCKEIQIRYTVVQEDQMNKRLQETMQMNGEDRDQILKNQQIQNKRLMELEDRQSQNMALQWEKVKNSFILHHARKRQIAFQIALEANAVVLQHRADQEAERATCTEAQHQAALHRTGFLRDLCALQVALGCSQRNLADEKQKVDNLTCKWKKFKKQVRSQVAVVKLQNTKWKKKVKAENKQSVQWEISEIQKVHMDALIKVQEDNQRLVQCTERHAMALEECTLRHVRDLLQVRSLHHHAAHRWKTSLHVLQNHVDVQNNN